MVGRSTSLLAHIFKANVTTKAERMGIGLSISRTIVEAHGGKLWAENTGEPARFCFTLPVPGFEPGFLSYGRANTIFSRTGWVHPMNRTGRG